VGPMISWATISRWINVSQLYGLQDSTQSKNLSKLDIFLHLKILHF
jgi:hypothetical protein